jgi:hypothetical protein
MRTSLRLAAAAALTAAMTMIAVPAFADPGPSNGTQEMLFTCDGHPVTILTRANKAQAELTWSAAWVEGTGTAIPVSFEFAAVDDRTGATLFEEAVDHSPAHQNMQQVTCTDSETAPADDFFGGFVPTGVDPKDTIKFTITVVAAVPGGMSA